MNGKSLRVFVDSAVVWEGTVGTRALKLDGPVGIRSDNVRLEMDLQAGRLSDSHPDPVVPCKSGPTEAE